MTLLTGTLLAHGPRTICAALRLSGEADNARWSPLAASRCLLVLIVNTLLPASAVIEIAIDETLSATLGPQIEPPRALPRQRALQPQVLGEQPRTARDA